MTGALYYPPADRSQWYGSGNATVAPRMTLHHSTETPGGWPGYQGGAVAPGTTYEPWQFAWRQHFPLNGTARALKNGPGYSTNRMGVDQIEVSCYCDPAVLGRALARELDGRAAPGSIADVLERFGSIEFPDDPDLHDAVQESLAAGKVRGLLPEASLRTLSLAAERHVSKLSQRAYDEMGARAEFMRREWGIPPAITVPTKPYPASYGQGNGVRLSAAAFSGYRGHLMHEHAPYNDHGDAGALDVGRILAAAGSSTAAPQEDDMGYLIRSATGAVVFIGAQGPRLVKTPSDLGVLEQLGYTYGPRGAAPALFKAMDDGPFALVIEQNGGLVE